MAMYGSGMAMLVFTSGPFVIVDKEPVEIEIARKVALDINDEALLYALDAPDIGPGGVWAVPIERVDGFVRCLILNDGYLPWQLCYQ